MILESTDRYFITKMTKQDIPQVAAMQLNMLSKESSARVIFSLANELAQANYLYLVLHRETPETSMKKQTGRIFKVIQPHIRFRLWAKFFSGIKKGSLAFLNKNVKCRELLGFVGLWFGYNEVHIISIYVNEMYRGKGLGELLQIAAIRSAISSGSDSITLEVRLSNLVAQRLYEKYGLEKTGYRYKYYRDNDEDALIMTNPNIQTSDYEASYYSKIAVYENRWKTSFDRGFQCLVGNSGEFLCSRRENGFST